jgi:hypothetical protein
MYIYIIFYLFPEKSENTEPSIHVHICFLLSASSAYWEYRTLYTYTSIFSSFCLQRILRIQNTEHSIHVHLCFLLSVSRDYWEYRTQYTCTCMFSSFLLQKYTENTEHRTQYTCTSMFSSFCFQRLLRIQNPVYMYIYVFFFLLLENTENTEPSIHVHLSFLLSVSRENWEYRTQYTCTSMFSSFCFQRILRIQNPVYMYIYVFFFLFPENTENTEPTIHVHLCFLLSISKKCWEYRTQYTFTSMFSSFCFQRILRIQNPEYFYIYVFLVLFPVNTENTEHSIHVHLCFLLSISRKCWEYRTQYTCTYMFSSFYF